MSNRPERTAGNNKKEFDQIERERFFRYRGEIARHGEESFVAAHRLYEIRESDLFRVAYDDYGAFCADVLGCSRSKGDRIASSWPVSEIANEALAPFGRTLKCISQTRPLLGRSREQIQQIILRAVERAGSGPLTFEQILNAKNDIMSPGAKSPASKSTVRVSLNEAQRLFKEGKEARAKGDVQELARVLDHLEKLIVGESGSEQSPAPSPAPPINVVVPPSQKPTAGVPPTAPASPSKPQKKRREKVPVGEFQIGDDSIEICAFNEVPVAAIDWLLSHGHSLPALKYIRPEPKGYIDSARWKPLSNGKWIEIGDSRKRLIEKTGEILGYLPEVNRSLLLRTGDVVSIPSIPLPVDGAARKRRRTLKGGYSSAQGSGPSSPTKQPAERLDSRAPEGVRRE